MEHQFKIGDRVRVMGSRPADWRESPVWAASMDGYAGKEGVVYLIAISVGVRFEDGKFSVSVRFEDGKCWNYKPSWLIPIPAKEEALLKVGDRVRVLCSKPTIPAGTILSIDGVDSDDPNLPYNVGCLWYSKDQVELVESSVIESKQISIPGFDTIKKLFASGSSKESTTKLPLISKTKLLTTIKLD